MKEEAFDLSTLDLKASGSTESAMPHYQVFKNLMKEDADDFAAEYKVAGKKKTPAGKGTGKRGRPKKNASAAKDDNTDPEDAEPDAEQDEDYGNTARRLAVSVD